MIPLYDDNPTVRTPYLTVGLIAACIMVFLWQVSLGPRLGQAAVYSFGFIPAVFFDQANLPAELAVIPSGLTLFSSMFMHGDLMHLAGNMLYLWIFGNNIEDVCGHGRFIAFYLLCGIAAAFAQALPDPGSEIPMIGASGAISGVLGAYLLLFPHARV
ncbi:MAG: rhomboid family intramembrane serine protease, partial [Geminicoccaceae bacterium]|nr:rhomboid family intramembrane serine protease [Geminicoccaceae bacterium]